MELKDSGTEENRSPETGSLARLPILIKTEENGLSNDVRTDFVRVIAGNSGASLSNSSSKTSLRGSRKSPSPASNDARPSILVKDLWSIVRKVRAKKKLKKEALWYGSSDKSITIRERLATATANKALDVGEAAVDGMEISGKEDDVLAERLALIKKEKNEYWMRKREELRSQNWSAPSASGLQNSAPVVEFRKTDSGVTEVRLPDGQRLFRDYGDLQVARDTLTKNNVREFRDDTPIQDRTSRESTRTSRTYTDRSDRLSTADSRGSVIHSLSAPAMVESMAASSSSSTAWV